MAASRVIVTTICIRRRNSLALLAKAASTTHHLTTRDACQSTVHSVPSNPLKTTVSHQCRGGGDILNFNWLTITLLPHVSYGARDFHSIVDNPQCYVDNWRKLNCGNRLLRVEAVWYPTKTPLDKPLTAQSRHRRGRSLSKHNGVLNPIHWQRFCVLERGHYSQTPTVGDWN